MYPRTKLSVEYGNIIEVISQISNNPGLSGNTQTPNLLLSLPPPRLGGRRSRAQQTKLGGEHLDSTVLFVRAAPGRHGEEGISHLDQCLPPLPPHPLLLHLLLRSLLHLGLPLLLQDSPSEEGEGGGVQHLCRLTSQEWRGQRWHPWRRRLRSPWGPWDTTRAPSPSAAQDPQGLLAALRPWQSSVSLELSGATPLPGPSSRSAARVWPTSAAAAPAASWRLRRSQPWPTAGVHEQPVTKDDWWWWWWFVVVVCGCLVVVVGAVRTSCFCDVSVHAT